MYKVVYNSCFGGFELSVQACNMLNELKGKQVADPDWGFVSKDLPRHDPDLVSVVEQLGCVAASGSFASLQLAKVKDLYRITEYDGSEVVETPDSIRWIKASEI